MAKSGSFFVTPLREPVLSNDEGGRAALYSRTHDIWTLKCFSWEAFEHPLQEPKNKVDSVPLIVLSFLLMFC